MLIQNFTLRTAGAGLAVVIFLALQPLNAQTLSDSDRLEKLERAVEQLQKRNAELEVIVKSLKKQNAFTQEIDANGNKKPKFTRDGKTYVETRTAPEDNPT